MSSINLLKGRKKLMYPDDVKTNPCYGHCYHSSQALFYLMNTDQLVPMSAEMSRFLAEPSEQNKIAVSNTIDMILNRLREWPGTAYHQ